MYIPVFERVENTTNVCTNHFPMQAGDMIYRQKLRNEPRGPPGASCGGKHSSCVTQLLDI